MPYMCDWTSSKKRCLSFELFPASHPLFTFHIVVMVEEKAHLPVALVQAGIVFVMEEITENEHSNSLDMQIPPLSCTENR